MKIFRKFSENLQENLQENLAWKFCENFQSKYRHLIL